MPLTWAMAKEMVEAAKEIRQDDVLRILELVSPSDVEFEKWSNGIGFELQSLLSIACYWGLQRVVERLIELGIDTPKLKFCRIHHAVALIGGDPLSRLLVRSCVDLYGDDANGNTPLHYACRSGNHETVTSLLQVSASVNSVNRLGETPLHNAAKSNLFSVIDMLIDAQADVNAENYEGCTPLHDACKFNSQESVISLLDRGSNVNAVDYQDETPLHVACYRHYPLLIEILYTRGADVNAKSGHGQTPLHVSVLRGNEKGVLMLLKFGADVNAKNDFLETPLHHAKSASAVKSLLDAGAYLHVLDHSGCSPFFKAINYSYSPEIVFDYGAFDRIAPKSFYADIIDQFSPTKPNSVLCFMEYCTKITTARLNLYKTSSWSNYNVPKIFGLDSEKVSLRREHYRKNCEIEIGLLKRSMLTEAGDVSYYDVLHHSGTIVGGFSLKGLDEVRLQEQFPIYGRLLALNWIKIATTLGSYRFFQLTPDMSGMPPELVDKICQYLTLNDLRNLTQISEKFLSETTD